MPPPQLNNTLVQPQKTNIDTQNDASKNVSGLLPGGGNFQKVKGVKHLLKTSRSAACSASARGPLQRQQPLPVAVADFASSNSRSKMLTSEILATF